MFDDGPNGESKEEKEALKVELENKIQSIFNSLGPVGYAEQKGVDLLKAYEIIDEDKGNYFDREIARMTLVVVEAQKLYGMKKWKAARNELLDAIELLEYLGQNPEYQGQCSEIIKSLEELWNLLKQFEALY